MIKKQSRKELESTVLGGILTALIISVLTTLLGTAVSAYLIHTEMISQESMGAAVITVLAISAASGAAGAIYKVKRLKMQMCLLLGASYYLLLLSITALFLGGQYDGIAAAGLSILMGCGAVAILNVIPGKKGNSYKRKKVYR